jgi:hypothetical protein
MEPGNASDPMTNSAVSVTITTVLFTLVEILKYGLKINGKPAAVQLLTLFLAEALSFAYAFYGTPEMPTVSGYLIFNTALRGLLITGAALGLHNVRSTQQDKRAKEDTSPVADVAQAVSDAQDATAHVSAALNRAQSDASEVAGGLSDATLPANRGIPE